MLLQSYINYFESLAQRHHLIQHQIDTPGTTDVPAGARRFATYNVDDVLLKQLRTSVGFPALLLEVYEFDLKSENVYDQKTEYKGAFSIVDHANHRDYLDERRALANTEEILWDLLQQVATDHYGTGACACESPFTRLDLNPANASPIGPVFDNEFGWRFEFAFWPKVTRSLAEPPPYGTFLPAG